MTGSMILAVALSVVFFLAVYVGGMFIFRECKEVDRERHANSRG